MGSVILVLVGMCSYSIILNWGVILIRFGIRYYEIYFICLVLVLVLILIGLFFSKLYRFRIYIASFNCLLKRSWALLIWWISNDLLFLWLNPTVYSYSIRSWLNYAFFCVILIFYWWLSERFCWIYELILRL